MIFSFTLCLILFSNVLHAQDNTNSGQRILKLYLNGVYSNTEESRVAEFTNDTLTYLSENDEYDFGGVSFAIEMITDKFFSHEFEIMPIKIRHNDYMESITFSSGEEPHITAGGKSTLIESAFRYQANHYFIRDRRTAPYIGLSTQVFYNRNKITPYTSQYYENAEQNLGLHFAITPGISFIINDKIAIDLNIPFELYEFKLNRVRNDNPMLPVEEKIVTTLIGEFAPKVYVVRVGVSYRI